MFKMNTFLNGDLLNGQKRRLNAMGKHGIQTGRTLEQLATDLSGSQKELPGSKTGFRFKTVNMSY